MTIPLENLDDKTYADLVKESLARIPVYAPQWTDWNESDPGITLIELLAWLTEMQIYSLNRIDDRSRLKFLKLLGVPRLYPPRPAEVDLTFELKGNSAASIPRGALVSSLNHGTGDLVCFETVNEVSLSPSSRTATVHAVQGMENSREFQSDGSPNLMIELDESMFLRSTETIGNMLKVWVHGVEWAYKEDLDGSGKYDPHFTADPEDGTITFGDGVRGKIPSNGKIIVKYRSGVGSRGNVRARAINQIQDDGLASIMTVMNQDAAYGGTDADEPIESAIGRARRDLKEVARAVTAADYEHLALTCPDVRLARVKALEMHHPSYNYRVPTAVSVVIVPESTDPQAKPTQTEFSLVRDLLENYRLLGTNLFVLPPEYVKVKVETEVAKDPRYKNDSVIEAVKRKLAEFLDPRKGGGPDGVGWPFGRPVYLSEVMQVIDGAEGVDHVKECRLWSWVEESDGSSRWKESEDDKILIPASSLVYSIPEDHIVTVYSGDEQVD